LCEESVKNASSIIKKKAPSPHPPKTTQPLYLLLNLSPPALHHPHLKHVNNIYFMVCRDAERCVPLRPNRAITSMDDGHQLKLKSAYNCCILTSV
jgi:hypothetical protein